MSAVIEAIPGNGPLNWDEFFNWMENDAYETIHSNGDDDCEGTSNQVLYIYFDHADNPIYVGITSNLSARLKAHERSSSWFPRAATYRWRNQVCCRACVDAMETHAIRLLAPRFNIAKKVVW